MRRVLIMACSATKRDTPGAIPAIDRYDGPMWQTLRAVLTAREQLARDVRAGDLSILVLSAEHGLISAYDRIADYDRELTGTRAEKLAQDRPALRICGWLGAAEQIAVAGGSLYRITALRLIERALQHVPSRTRELGVGQGIGEQRATLRAWLIGQEA